MYIISSIVLLIVLFILLLNIKHKKYYYCIGDIPGNQNRIYRSFNYLKSNNPSDCDLFIPSQFNDADSEIVNNKSTIKQINGILKMDYICSKANLKLFLASVYDEDVLDTLVPRTYLSKYIKDVINSNLQYQDKKYILKKDIQQQKGLFISNNTDEIIKLANDPAIVVMQEFLQYPFIIPDHTNERVINRKINLRIYILVTIDHGEMRVFVYKDGFLYYTPESFDYMSLDPNKLITSGYIDRGVYDRNPLTLKDLEQYVNIRNYSYASFWETLKRKLVLMFVPFGLAWKDENSSNIHYQIFGADVEPNSEFNDMKIIEVNKGPDLSSKSERDIELKDKMFNDSLQIVLNNNIASTDFEEL